MPESRLYSQKRRASIRDQVEASGGEGQTKERKSRLPREDFLLPEEVTLLCKIIKKMKKALNPLE